MLKSFKSPRRLAIVLACLVLGVLIGLNQRQIVDAGTNPTAPTAAIRPEYVYGLANYTGAGVVQDSQAQPQLKATYQSGSATDPWLGGKLNIDWTDYLDLRMGGGQLVTAATFGFGFVAHVNLPSRINADDVLAAMDFSTAKLTVKSATFPLQRDNFEKIGPHTLRLTMRDHNGHNLNWGVLEVLQGIVNDGFSLNHVYVNFNIDVDIAKLTVDGQPDDTSPNKILTKGHFAPAPDKKHQLSVDFYGADDIKEGAASFFGLSPTGYLYANLNPDGIFKACNRATTTMKTWNSYISPTDNQGTENTNQDQAEVVDGSAANLPGQVNQRSVTLGYRAGTFAAQPADRFNRVVNYFTKQNVTTGAQLTHTPLKTTGYNQPTTVVYSGTDSEGTKLSPVALKVTDSHRNNGQVKLTNLTNTVLPNGGGMVGTAISQGTNFTMKGWWQAPDLDHGAIRYRVLALKAGQSLAEATPVAGRADLLFQTITNSPNYSQTHATSAVLAGLPAGRYVLDTKIVDDAEPDQAQWASTQYLAHPDQNAYPPLIAVVDLPQMALTSQVTNTATHETGQTITALAGDLVHSTTTITAGTDGTASLEQAALQLQIPTGTTYQAGSLTVTINGQPQSGMTANFSAGTAKIALPQAVKAGDTIKLGLDYQVNDLSDQTLTATPVTLSGKVTVPTDNGTAPAPVSLASNAIAIKIPVAELKLVNGPADFTFGHNVDLPYQPVDLPAKTANLAFTVWDSRAPQMKSNWQITASLSKPFTTATGAILPTAQLDAKIGNEQHAISAGQETPIYTHEGNARGKIAVQLAKTNQLILHVDPNAGIQTDVAYQGEIQWQLVDGPQ